MKKLIFKSLLILLGVPGMAFPMGHPNDVILEEREALPNQIAEVPDNLLEDIGNFELNEQQLREMLDNPQVGANPFNDNNAPAQDQQPNQQDVNNQPPITAPVLQQAPNAQAPNIHPNIADEPEARRPNAQGPFYRAVRPQPAPNYGWLKPIGIALLAGLGYGCYQLYLHFIAPTPHKLKDIKRALIDLNKEVVRAKKAFESESYEPGTLKAYFDAQIEVGSFASLTQEARTRLAECIEQYEQSLSTFGPIERAYAATRQCISRLVQQVNAIKAS